MGALYLKLKNSNILVEPTTFHANSFTFSGLVKSGDSFGYKAGDYSEAWELNQFEPYEAAETTQTEQSPTKDIELRLECLKLAIQANFVDPVIAAKEYYYWITKTPNQ